MHSASSIRVKPEPLDSSVGIPAQSRISTLDPMHTLEKPAVTASNGNGNHQNHANTSRRQPPQSKFTAAAPPSSTAPPSTSQVTIPAGPSVSATLPLSTSPASITAPANLYKSPDGSLFYVTLLKMKEKGGYSPITQIAIMDPGFPIPPESLIEFYNHNLGTGPKLIQSIIDRYFTVAALHYNDPNLPVEKQEKYTKEYRKFFQFLSSQHEQFAQVKLGSFSFFLKGPDASHKSRFTHHEPVMCFFASPYREWQPSPNVNEPSLESFRTHLPTISEAVFKEQIAPYFQPHSSSATNAQLSHNSTSLQLPVNVQPLTGTPVYRPASTAPPSSASSVASHSSPGSPVKSESANSPVLRGFPSKSSNISTATATTAASSSSSSSAASASTALVPSTSTSSSSSFHTMIISPNFLRSITHVHDWMWGAVAELVHNSRDAGAKNCRIYTRMLKVTGALQPEPHLYVEDDGHGMTHQQMKHAFTFGQERTRDANEVGQYGFGLKHGSMRLGDDLLVLTKTDRTFSVGLLSQTYNKSQTSIQAPIVTYTLNPKEYDLRVHSKEQAEQTEEIIKRYTAFDRFELGSALTRFSGTGTAIIIWKLRRAEADDDEFVSTINPAAKGKVVDKKKVQQAVKTKPASGAPAASSAKKKFLFSSSSESDSSSNASDGSDKEDEDPLLKQKREAHKQRLKALADARQKAQQQSLTSKNASNAASKALDANYELKFTSVTGDLQIVIDPLENMQERSHQMSMDVPLDYSLRAYLSVIFLDNRMQMFVQNQLVKFRDWNTFLTTTKTYPCPVKHFERCKLLLGYSEEEKNKGNAGIMLYWHKTLIETYRRVGIQTGNSDAGLGVIGVIDMGEKVKPNNNKQGFPDSNKYFRKLLKWLGMVLDSYWHDVLERDVIPTTVLDPNLKYDFSQSVQCERCQKWRRISEHELQVINGKINEDGSKGNGVSKSWYCYMNKDPRYNSCEVPQDPSLDDKEEISVSVSRGQKSASPPKFAPPPEPPAAISKNVPVKYPTSTTVTPVVTPKTTTTPIPSRVPAAAVVSSIPASTSSISSSTSAGVKRKHVESNATSVDGGASKSSVVVSSRAPPPSSAIVSSASIPRKPISSATTSSLPVPTVVSSRIPLVSTATSQSVKSVPIPINQAAKRQKTQSTDSTVSSAPSSTSTSTSAKEDMMGDSEEESEYGDSD